MFTHIGNVISNQWWYQENRAYRPQLITYTFAKLVQIAKANKKEINYREIWDKQDVPVSFDKCIEDVSKIIYDVFNDPNRSTSNIETYSKKQECWIIASKVDYIAPEDYLQSLISPQDKSVEVVMAKKEQKIFTGLLDEVGIYSKGIPYWTSLIERGKTQEVLNYYEIKALEDAINYCKGKYLQLSKKQVKDILNTISKLAENGIE